MASNNSNGHALFDLGEPAKRCPRCKQLKNVCEFTFAKSPRTGIVRPVSYCKKCITVVAHKWRRDNPDKAATMSRRWELAKYGLTPEAYQDMVESQHGVCAICKGPPQPHSRGKGPPLLSVDHDHKTGRVRGLLCFNCNTLLGKARDNVIFLEAAIAYLKRHQSSFSTLDNGCGTPQDRP